MKHSWIIVALLALIAFALSFAAGYRTAARRPLEIQRDTVEVVRVDTLVVDNPVPVYHRIVDTLRVPVRVCDTIKERDTVLVELPLEQVVYQDTLYRAVVSGYKPALDTIEVFAPSKIVTITEKVPVEETRRWGIGVTAGYGATVTPERKVQLAPFIGIGLTYNIACW